MLSLNLVFDGGCHTLLLALTSGGSSINCMFINHGTDVVYMLEGLGIESDIDLNALAAP
ncbi:hypothetical protein [Vreelandella populi]|uniref:hypothetical protein n=1 Tax=Vreelandella populi TaxID=2498858 RepID=UPI00163D0130|nr:hypothetical protein [Halomonas populi]